jgi:hypothetical protein
MEPAVVERLKREWTNRRVAVVGNAPALRRFAGRTGTVLTINMNGRALVRFDGTADIGWYDLPLDALRTVISPPRREETAPPPAGEPPVTSATKPETVPETATASATTAEKPRTRSILELARQQGAAKR